MVYKKIIILFKKIIDLFYNKSAIALMEFALILPILVLILVSSMEISNTIYASQKNQSVATLTANLIGDLDSLIDNTNKSQITSAMQLSDKITKSFVEDSKTDIGIVVTILGRGKVQDGTERIFIVYQEKKGMGHMVESDFKFKKLNKDVDADYVEQNAISRPLETFYNNYLYAGNQIIIVETRIALETLLTSKMSEAILGVTPVQYFKNSPTSVRIKRFKTIPGGTNGYYTPY